MGTVPPAAALGEKLSSLVNHRQRIHSVLVAISALGIAALFWLARPLRSENFVFYLPTARHVLGVTTIEQAKYLQLLHVLNLVGKVGALQEKRGSLKVWFGEAEIELRQDNKKVQVNKTTMTLADPVRVVNGQWMVPVDFLPGVLPRLTRDPIEYQVGTNRIFIGDVKPTSFTVRLDSVPGGARLTVQFTEKVALRTAASDGKWVLFLERRAVEPLEASFRFTDPYISELRFDDQDGHPKLIITPAAGGLNFYPSLAESGKVLLADVLKPSPVTTPPTGEPSPAPAAPAVVPAVPPVPGEAELPGEVSGPPLPVVVLDAGHGGSDLGARSRDAVFEKDLVAQLVARVRHALLATGKYRVVLTRVGDVSLSFDERATSANRLRPIAFLTLHAGKLGVNTPRVTVYSYQPSSLAPPPEDEPATLFVPWARAQQLHIERSRELARALSQQLAQIPGLTTDAPREAPVRALRSVDAPAVAVEIGTLSEEEDSHVLANPTLHHLIAAAIARALETFPRRSS